MIILNASGNITADAKVRTIGSNTVTSFTIASNARFKTAIGDTKDETTYVRCSLWNNEEAAKLLYKGRSLNVVGSFKMNIWENSNGEKIPSLDLRVSFFQVFGKNEKKEVVTETHTAPVQPVTQEEAKQVEDDLPF
jgi:single stranded DNA-binding protein